MVIIKKYEEILSGKRAFIGGDDNETLFMAYAQTSMKQSQGLTFTL